MKVEQILKSITPEVKKREIEKINEVKLPAELQRWVDEYEKVGGERNVFIWKWLYVMDKIVVYSIVKKKYRKSLIKIKFLFEMFIILLDDVSEKKGNHKLLNELLHISFKKKEIKFCRLKKEEKKYLKFTIKLWNEIESTIKKYPHHKEFKEIFDYDVAQLLNAIKYANLLHNNYYLINEEEYWMYLPWSMQIVISYDIDLMCMSKFSDDDLRIYREVVLYAQKMGRIGNWVSTWERELREGDFSSCVFPYALKHNLFTLRELKNKNNVNKILAKIENLEAEKYLLKKWDEYYKEIDKFDKFSNAIDIKGILKTLEYLIFMHLISRGFK